MIPITKILVSCCKFWLKDLNSLVQVLQIRRLIIYRINQIPRPLQKNKQDLQRAPSAMTWAPIPLTRSATKLRTANLYMVSFCRMTSPLPLCFFYTHNIKRPTQLSTTLLTAGAGTGAFVSFSWNSIVSLSESRLTKSWHEQSANESAVICLMAAAQRHRGCLAFVMIWTSMGATI